MAVAANELIGALQKAGADPNASSFDMSKAIPGLQGRVQSDMQQSDPALASLSSTYRSQLDQIAQMDQKLSGVFGNPGSPLYIEHAGSRNSVVSGAHNVGSKFASNTASQGRQRQSDIQSDSEEAVQLFKQLQQVKIKEERLAKQKAKGTGGTAKGKKSLSQKVADARDRKQEVETQQLYLAGIDPEKNKQAADVFLNQFTAKAQEQWIREGQQDENGGLSNPKPGDLTNYLKYWKETFQPKAAQKSVQERAQESVDLSNAKKAAKGKTRQSLF